MKRAGYSFQFVGTNTLGADKYLLETLVYAFKSQKSGHDYQVNIEHDVEHLYCVKFFDMTVNTMTDQTCSRYTYYNLFCIFAPKRKNETMSEYYYYGLAAMLYLPTCWAFAAVRWWHTCREPKSRHDYIWPDRKLMVVAYLCATVTLPSPPASRPTTPTTAPATPWASGRSSA